MTWPSTIWTVKDRLHRPARGAPSNASASALAHDPAEHPLLTLQRQAGNAAVAGLVGKPSVQRFWPFDDDEEEEQEEGTGETTGGVIDPSQESDYWPPGTAVFTGYVAHGHVGVTGLPGTKGAPWDEKAVLEAWPVVWAEASSLPYEPIPTDEVGFGGTIRYMRPPFGRATQVSDARDLIARQVMRHVSGSHSPDVWRLMEGTSEPGGEPAGSGGSGPGGPQSGGPRQGAGGGAGGAPGGLGGGGLPGLEPIGGGGYGAGWPAAPKPGEVPSIPGLESIPGAGPVGAGGGGPSAGPGGPTNARPMLRRGSTGSAVIDLQGLLTRHGSKLEPDGIFGGQTRQAVVDFQRRARLDADGIVGPKTWQALDQG